MRRAAFAAALLAGTLAACSHRTTPALAPRAAGRLAIDGGTIVDPRDGRHQPGMSVLVDRGRIVAIVPAAASPRDPAVRHIDAKGEYIIPGLLDMHAHPLNAVDPTDALELMLANGITGFRQMSGTADLLAKKRAGTLPIPQASPALLATPGEILTPLNARSPAAAVAEVDRQKAQGADFIKVIQVTPATFAAAEAEAKRVGLPFAGHLPDGVDPAAASAGGMRSIEHLGPGLGILAVCSRDAPQLQAAIAALPPVKGPPVRFPGFVRAMLARSFAKQVINPAAGTAPDLAARLHHAIDTFDPARCQALARLFVANGTWQVPTLIRLRTMELGDAPEYARDPNLAFVPRATVAGWREAAARFHALPPATRATYAALYPLQLKLVKLFDAAGVSMLTGSDLGGGWVVPGVSLHQEFDQLAAAGLAPATILRMATYNGAAFLGGTATMGAVAPGRNADLVLLKGDPTVSVANLHKVDAVVRGGILYTSNDLARIKARVRADAVR